MPELDDRVKSFWNKPEGKLGAVVAAGLAVGALVGIGKILPWLIQVAQNTLHLMVLLGSIGAIIFVVSDPRFRNLVSYMYRMSMRWITGMFVMIDPIGILKAHIDELKHNHARMNDQISNLRGTMRTLARTIEENEESARHNMSMASQAKEKGMKSQLVLNARRAGRLQKSNMTLKDLHRKMEVIYRVLSKMYENCGVLIEDTEDQVQVKEAEWKAIQASHKAMRSAMSVINGNADKRAIYEQTLEMMADDLGAKVGEMERFMEISQSFMDGVDLQNGVFEEKGLEMLEKWGQDADSWLLPGDEKQALIAQANDDREILKLEAPGVGRQSQYATLFREPNQMKGEANGQA